MGECWHTCDQCNPLLLMQSAVDLKMRVATVDFWTHRRDSSHLFPWLGHFMFCSFQHFWIIFHAVSCSPSTWYCAAPAPIAILLMKPDSDYGVFFELGEQRIVSLRWYYGAENRIVGSASFNYFPIPASARLLINELWNSKLRLLFVELSNLHWR